MASIEVIDRPSKDSPAACSKLLTASALIAASQGLIALMIDRWQVKNPSGSGLSFYSSCLSASRITDRRLRLRDGRGRRAPRSSALQCCLKPR